MALTSKQRDAIWHVWTRTKAFDDDYKHIKTAYNKQGLFAETDIAKFIAKKYPNMVDDIVATAYATNFSGCGSKSRKKSSKMDGLTPAGYNNVSKNEIAKQMKQQFPKLAEKTIKELIDAYWETIKAKLKKDNDAFIRINNVGSFRIVTKSYNKILGKGKGSKTKKATTNKLSFKPSKKFESVIDKSKNKSTSTTKSSSTKTSTSKSTTSTTTKKGKGKGKNRTRRNH